MKAIWATIIKYVDPDGYADVDIALWDSEEAASAVLVGYDTNESERTDGTGMEVRKFPVLNIDDVRDYLIGDLSGEGDRFGNDD